MKKVISNPALKKSSFFVFSLLFANALNFLFNAYLGRVLNFADYGLVTVIISLWNLISIPLATLGGTVNYSIAFLSGQSDAGAPAHFFLALKRKSFLIVSIVSLLWLFFSPFIASFFQISNVFAVTSLSFVTILGALIYLNRGFLQGAFLFELVGITMIAEAIIKLASAFAFVLAGKDSWVYLALPVSILGTYLMSKLFVSSKTKEVAHSSSYRFPRKFFVISLLSAVSSAVFLSIDVILVKHFFSPEIAGQYALLALVGKMVYFLGTLLNSIIFTYISREAGKYVRNIRLFYKLLSISILMTAGAYVLLGPLGYLTVPLLFGAKAIAIVRYLPTYTLAMSLFTISSIFLTYHLVYKEYFYTYLSIVAAFAMGIGITFWHSSLLQVSYAILSVSVMSFVVMMSGHAISTLAYVKSAARND